jgi:prepilin-type N-terminal cleavage/methylation domain-containing protein
VGLATRSISGVMGFTLVELMVVIVIVGIMSTIGISNYINMQDNAKTASCISNQRHVHHASMVYAIDNNTGTVNINVQVLTAAGLLVQDVGECPASGNVDFDDYTIAFLNGEVDEVACSIRPNQHSYDP